MSTPPTTPAALATGATATHTYAEAGTYRVSLATRDDRGRRAGRELAVVEPAEEGRLVVEFGFGQAAGIRALAESAGWRVARIRDDLQGIPRTAVLRR